MPDLPVVSGDEFVKAMARLGYILDRMRGSHMILRRPGRRQLSVPRHRQLDRGLLRGLIRDAGITVDEFVELLDR
jgi:predicted RNA binding protein YcfA (HicA-like mRNA interferase family)